MAGAWVKCAACGDEFESDIIKHVKEFERTHAACKTPENEALTLLTRLVTAAEAIVEHCKGRK
jgi:hypothetical protein